jgi:hypothetical protein
MDTRIEESLFRQMKGFELLQMLLGEEYALLRGKDPQLITQIEFSIQELVQQLSNERKLLVKQLKGRRIKQFLAALPATPKAQAVSERILGLANAVDALEQTCARLAKKNKQLVLALMDQSQEVVDFLYAKLVPKPKVAYSPKGRFTTRRPEATLLEGKL